MTEAGRTDGARQPTDAEALEATPSDLSLAEVLLGAAEEAATAIRTEAGTLTTWSAGSPPVVFATLAGGRAEFRLDPVIANAALRTPDTVASTRGPEWVAFEPAVVDDGAVDRAEAWFLVAHRRAGRRRA
jgi:hypothetical protein